MTLMAPHADIQVNVLWFQGWLLCQLLSKPLFCEVRELRKWADVPLYHFGTLSAPRIDILSTAFGTTLYIKPSIGFHRSACLSLCHGCSLSLVSGNHSECILMSGNLSRVCKG